MSINTKKERDSSFANKKGNLKRLPSCFYYDVFKFEEYNHTINDGQHIIYVKVNYDTSVEKYFSQIECKTPDLLLKMLSLRDNLPSDLFDSPSKILFCDKYLNDKTITAITTWCKKYGFPFNISINSRDIMLKRKSKLLFNVNKPDKYISFYVSDFLYHLNEVYSAFRMYRALTGNQDKIESPVYTTGFIKESISTKDFLDVRNLNIDQCKALFEHKYQNITFENSISFEIEPHFIVKTKNLFNSAFYQLSLLLYDNEKELKVCPLCHEYFEPKDPRQKYCNSSECYPQKAYKRRNALKTKK